MRVPCGVSGGLVVLGLLGHGRRAPRRRRRVRGAAHRLWMCDHRVWSLSVPASRRHHGARVVAAPVVSRGGGGDERWQRARAPATAGRPRVRNRRGERWRWPLPLASPLGRRPRRRRTARHSDGLVVHEEGDGRSQQHRGAFATAPGSSQQHRGARRGSFERQFTAYSGSSQQHRRGSGFERRSNAHSGALADRPRSSGGSGPGCRRLLPLHRAWDWPPELWTAAGLAGSATRRGRHRRWRHVAQRQQQPSQRTHGAWIAARCLATAVGATALCAP